MKFSIQSLLTLMTLTALALLAMRNYRLIPEGKLIIADLQNRTDAANLDYQIAKHQVAVCQQVLQHGQPQREQLADEAIQRFVTQRGEMRLDGSFVQSIPVATSHTERVYQWRVVTTESDKTQLVAYVDRVPAGIPDDATFSPAETVIPLPIGESVIQLTAKVAQPKSGTIDLVINDEPAKTIQYTRLPSTSAPSLSAKQVVEPKSLSGTRRPHLLFYASHFRNRAGAETLKLELRKVESADRENSK